MSKATAEDATLILRLYELRTEATMRKARTFVIGEFWPQSGEEVLALLSNFGSQENAYMRQVITYWEMAASFVLRGALNEELFADSGGELFFIYAKFSPFLSKIREVNPGFLGKSEEFVQSSKDYEARIGNMKKTIAQLGSARAAKAS
jgi:hypothetical protein